MNDLEAERRAVQDALGDQCIVRHSYRASEDALVGTAPLVPLIVIGMLLTMAGV